MNDEDKIKPAEIQDEALNEVQGGLRVMHGTGVRVPNRGAVSAEVVTEQLTDFQDGDDMVLRKRPGRKTYSNVTLKRG